MNAKLVFQRSQKRMWYQLVDEFMYDRANVVPIVLRVTTSLATD